jgi:hypothetical protein
MSNVDIDIGNEQMFPKLIPHESIGCAVLAQFGTTPPVRP